MPPADSHFADCADIFARCKQRPIRAMDIRLIVSEYANIAVPKLPDSSYVKKMDKKDTSSRAD